jgi:hypothetical protein
MGQDLKIVAEGWKRLEGEIESDENLNLPVRDYSIGGSVKEKEKHKQK